MTLQVTDVLLNPISNPLEFAEVHLATVTNGNEILMSSEAKAMTDETGNIAFSLVQGTYRVYLKQRDAEIMYPIGYINASIFDTADSPTTLTAIISEALE